MFGVFERVGDIVRRVLTVVTCEDNTRCIGGAATSPHVGCFVRAGSERLRDHVRLSPASVRTQVASGQVGPSIAAANGRSLSSGTFRGTALASRKPAADDAIRAEVTRHVVTIGRWELRRFRC